ncbi:MAG: glycosyltransferase family 2 protein, partial [Microcoleaceae cyanobacterium]
MPRVSVIIPVYHSANYISEALDSVLSQTYHDYEIIVVNDGSTDNICEVLSPYENKINYFYQENQGSAVARNLGIAKAKGELIAFLDADDFWLLLNKLDEQVNYLLKDSSLGSVHTGWRVMDGNGRKVIDVEPWYSMPEINLVSWLMYKPIRLSGMIIRQSWLVKVGGFDGDLRQSHDVDLMLRLALLGCSAIWWPAVAVGYRRYAGNTTRNTRVQADC